MLEYVLTEETVLPEGVTVLAEASRMRAQLLRHGVWVVIRSTEEGWRPGLKGPATPELKALVAALEQQRRC